MKQVHQRALCGFGILSSVILITGCSLLPKINPFATGKIIPAKSANYNVEKDTIIDIRQDLNTAKFDQVKEKTANFIEKYPQSTFLNEALYYQALSFESNEDWELALSNYQKIIELSIDGSREFLALSLYRKANCYEARHENELALASLFDALHYKAYLPMEVAEAEIPARMASIYASLKQPPQADYYTVMAEKGVRKVRQVKKNTEQEWLPHTLLQMGSISLGTISPETFFESLLSFSRRQKYLFQTIELKDAVWSTKAEDLLIFNYTQFLSTIKNLNINSSSDWEMDVVLKAEKQVEMASQLLESLELLKNLQTPEETSSAANTALLFEKLKPIEESATVILQKQTLLKPKQSLKSQLMSGNFETAEFEDEPPKELTQQFPKKTSKDKLNKDTSIKKTIRLKRKSKRKGP